MSAGAHQQAARPGQGHPAAHAGHPSTCPMPSAAQRERILKLILHSEPVDSDIEYQRLAACTEGFSGSDLHELCRQAAVYRVRDVARAHLAAPGPSKSSKKSNASDSEDEFVDAVRPITMDDLKASLSKLKEAKIQCGSLPPAMNRIELD
ncbi:hypothetical protein ACJJTC_012388 [Scirpophaga incertulas]